MFSGPDSPALTSILSLGAAAAAAVVACLYFGDAFESGANAALVIGMCLGFAAVVLCMFSLSPPGPGLVYAVIGMGIGIVVIVLGFLAILLELTRS